jgi:hypothetical protein
MNNGLSKEEQIDNGKLTKRKGDWCEIIVQAHFRKLGWLIYEKKSGPIDMVIINEETGEVRFIDVKYKNMRKGTQTYGARINRVVTTPLKNFIKIEIAYVDDNKNIEFAYADGIEKWHKEFKIARNANGQYTGEVLKK